MRDIPNYLKAVTILEPVGNPAAEVAAAVDQLWSPHPVISGLSSFAQLVGRSQEQLQTPTRERRDEIADYLDYLHDRLIDAHKVLQQGQIPHGTCEEILLAGRKLIKTIGDAIERDDVDALREQLETAYRVEDLLVALPDPPRARLESS